MIYNDEFVHSRYDRHSLFDDVSVELNKEMAMIKERAVAARVDDLAVAMDQFKKHTLRGKNHDMSTDDEWKVSSFCCFYYYSLRHT